MRRPFVWFLVSLITGIVAGRYSKYTFLGLFLFFIIWLSISVLFVKKLKILEPLFLPVIAVFGFLSCSMYFLPKTADRLIGNTTSVVGTVRNAYETDSGNAAITVDINSIGGIKENYKIMLYTKDKEISTGDIIKSEGKLYSFDEPTNPYQQNYKIIMFSDGYDYSFWCENVDVIGKSNGFIYEIESIREKINTFFDSAMSKREASMAKALVTGFKKNIEYSTRESFKKLGISHVLAVSGLHVSIVSYAILYLLTKILGIRRRKAVLPVSCILLVYMVFTGFSPSAIRAVIMSVTAFVGLFLFRDSNGLNTLSFTAFIMLLINPIYLWNISFQLSFLGAIAVVTALSMMMPVERRKTGHKIKEGFKFSIISWVIITPLLMYYYQGVSLVSVFSNIILVPFFGIMTVIAMALGLLSLLWLPLAYNLASIVSNILCIYNNIINKLAENAFVYMDTSRPGIVSIICVYIFIFAIVLGYNRKYIIKIVSVGLMVWTAFSIFGYIKAPAEIVFFDAGQGDASAVYIPRKLMAVIDGGPEGGAKKSVIPYLRAKGEKVDLLFVSHMDSDHVSGAIEIIENGLAEHIVVSDVEHENSDNYNKLIRAVENSRADIILAKGGDMFKIDDDCYFECLYPNDNVPENENDSSLVLKFTYSDTEFLFTGDISKKVERQLLDDSIKCDVIKIAHHGSNTSSMEEFIEKTDANIAIIQVEENNIYGLPSRNVTDLLDRLNIKTYITGTSGAITVIDNGESIDIKEFKNGKIR